MLFILSWLIYGIIVGSLAKFLHPGEDKMPFLATVGVGVAGSFLGGFINWAIGHGGSPISASGIVMGTIGGIIFCWIYRKYRLNQFFQAQGRLPGNLIHKKD